MSDSAWTIAFDTYEPADEGRREVLLALGNGMFVTRAASTFCRADGTHYPGTYRAGCYDKAVSEIHGERTENLSLVNLPNWLPLDFRISEGSWDDPWFDIDKAEITDYHHTVNLEHGITERAFVYADQKGRSTHVAERRLVSAAEPHLMAIQLKITPRDWSDTLEIRSSLDGNVINDNVPRYADFERRHINVTDRGSDSPDCIWLTARTRTSHVSLALAASTLVYPSPVLRQEVRSEQGAVANHNWCEAQKGESIVVEKIVAIFTSMDPGVSDPLAAAKHLLAKNKDFAPLPAAHKTVWQQLWRKASLDASQKNLALAMRFHIFHVLQTLSPHTAHLDAGVPARGWHGEGYRGHIFWDELFAFPFLYLRFPRLAQSLLLYRYKRLDAARIAAREHGYRGAMFPWRSGPDGYEVTPKLQKNLLSGRWMRDPTRLQRHIGSAVAYNTWHYFLATNDVDFLSDYGAEMIVEIARFWASIAEYSEERGRYEIKGVIGPDEYHNSYPDRDEPGLDNNAYTNLTAVWTLCRALEVLDYVRPAQREKLVDRLNLTREEFALWDNISRKMYVAFHDQGVISQYEGFNQLQEFDRDKLPKSLEDQRVDWALEAIGESADAYQVNKQADTLTLFYLFPFEEINELFQRLGYTFSHEQLIGTAEYYLARTTHRSSLSLVTYAGALSQVDLEQSWRFFQQSLKTDLHALKGESIAEGIHLGAMGGSIDVLQRCYLGLRPHLHALYLEPRLPPQLGCVAMDVHYQGNALKVDANGTEVRIRSHADNKAILISHAGQEILLRPGKEVRVEASTPVATT
jgi:trehalose/maltose hydrolase-like predicted phosphorylase